MKVREGAFCEPDCAFDVIIAELLEREAQAPSIKIDIVAGFRLHATYQSH